MNKIKLINKSGHSHGIKLIMPSGAYMEQNLKPNQWVMANEEQFYDWFVKTKDFKKGYIHFDIDGLPQEIKDNIGMFDEEVLDEVLTVANLSDEEILDKIKGQIGGFKAFMKEVKELDPKLTKGFYKRVATLGMSIPDLSRAKVEDIEKVTGIKFQENEELNKEN